MARFAFEAALGLNPVHPPALEALLPLLLRMGDWDTAARVADALLAVDPWHPLAGRASDALAAASRWVHPFTSERAHICVTQCLLDCLFLDDLNRSHGVAWLPPLLLIYMKVQPCHE